MIHTHDFNFTIANAIHIESKTLSEIFALQYQVMYKEKNHDRPIQNFMNDVVPLQNNPTTIIGYIQDQEQEIIGMFIGADIASYCDIYGDHIHNKVKNYGASFYFDSICVKKSYRNSGLGKYFYTQREECISKTYKQIALSCDKESTFLSKRYISLGYTIVQELEHDYILIKKF